MAENQTAATANTNPSDDVARAAQVSTPVNRTPLTEEEAKGVNAQEQSEGQPNSVQKPTPAENAADQAKKKPIVPLGDNKSSNVSGPVANPLDAYPTYTYGLSLFALTRSDFNRMVDDPLNFVPSKNLISSAGRYRSSRDPEFKDDFYFDNFKMTTVIGLNAGARGTNAITMDFTIIEPYGMTLLDRIMNIATNELSAKNYLDIPYLMRVEFFAADDQGNLEKLTEHTKNIPIKLINFKIRASVRGSEYQIQAVPFNHGANLESIQAIKTRMEVEAATVDQFFANTTDPTVAEQADTYRKNSADYNVKPGQATSYDEFGNPVVAGSSAATTAGISAPPTLPSVLKATSFTAAYNAWNINSVQSNDAKYADTISFVIDENIAKSKIVDAKKNSTKRAASTTASTTAKANEGADATTLNVNSVIHSFEAGTTVNDIINAIIPNSEFFLNQVSDSTQQAKTAVESTATSDSTTQEQAKTLKMWKIIPKLKLGEFDTERNIWGKNITFFVTTYDVYQQRDKRLPKSPPPKAVKRYDYFYTGKNSAVINFDIDFNALYFTAVQVDRANTAKTSGPQQKPDESNEDAPVNNTKKNDIAPTANRDVGTTFQTSVGGANNRSATQNAQSALQSIYTSAGGDMITLKLQIIGDPHFIKQDDLYISPDLARRKPTEVVSNFIPGTESLVMDEGELYCYVTFKTPKDFNDATGMYDLDSKNKYSVSEFSGYYRVLKVDSEFRSGKFTQTLEMVRQPEQDSPNASESQDTSNATKSAVERNKELSKSSNPAVQTQKSSSSGDVQTPDQPSPAVVVSKGPDADAATGSPVMPTAATVATDQTQQSDEDNILAKIAKKVSSFSLSDLTKKSNSPESQFNIPNE